MQKLKQGVGAYNKQALFGGWTRVEMLLQLYDRAIKALQNAELALELDQQDAFVTHYIESQKVLLAIHSGLKPDEYEVAFNVARLLHFVLGCIGERNFKDAIKILGELRNGFAAIAHDANELEKCGEIPAMEDHDDLYMPV